jgi:glutathione synthase/RimK-type ligase-like ATP-grasp enzyme
VEAKKIRIRNLQDIEEDKNISLYEWSPEFGARTPQYVEAVKHIRKMIDDGETSRSIEMAELLTEALPHELEPAILLAKLLLRAGDLEKAKQIFTDGTVPQRMPVWLSLRAAFAFQSKDVGEVQHWSRVYIDAVPACITSPQRTDLPLVGVVNLGPSYIQSPALPKHFHFSGNYISQLANLLPARHRFFSIFSDSRSAKTKQLNAPTPDVVVNNVVNGEILSKRKIYNSVRAVIDLWGRRAINGPEDARETTRDMIYNKTKNFPGLLSPKTEYKEFNIVNEDLISNIESNFNYPIIVRSPFFQFGTMMYLVHDRTELLERLDELKPGCFVIQFIENQRRIGFYCKMRCIFVKNNLHICRVDYLPQWKVHGAKLRSTKEGIEYYNNNKLFLEEEIAICKDPEKELGTNAINALHDIRSVIKLDCFGIDFDITNDGKIILFEANASMNFIGNKKRTLIRHPEEQERNMISDLYKMIDSQIYG